jgi:hypothetical protein
MVYSKIKLKRSGDKAPPCFRPLWIGIMRQNAIIYEAGLNISIIELTRSD